MTLCSIKLQNEEYILFVLYNLSVDHMKLEKSRMRLVVRVVGTAGVNIKARPTNVTTGGNWLNFFQVTQYFNRFHLFQSSGRKSFPATLVYSFISAMTIVQSRIQRRGGGRSP